MKDPRSFVTLFVGIFIMTIGLVSAYNNQGVYTIDLGVILFGVLLFGIGGLYIIKHDEENTAQQKCYGTSLISGKGEQN